MKRGHCNHVHDQMPKRRVHVVAAVILNEEGSVFLSRRPSYVDQGGLWEFPGGKLHANETCLEALKRELDEELGITVQRARPLIKVRHEYSDKHLLLDVWEVREFTGKPYGAEGQVVRWVPRSQLAGYSFPAANETVIKAAMLPHACMVTDEEADETVFQEALKASLDRYHPELIRLRAASLDKDAYLARARNAAAICQAAGARLMVGHQDVDAAELSALVEELDLAGVQLTEQQLLNTSERILPTKRWLAASVHNCDALKKAEAIECDFAMLGSVNATGSHPEAEPLHWGGLQRALDQVSIPVFAIGGMALADTDRARGVGAQGIAAISAFKA